MKKVTCAAGQYLQSVHLGWGALTRGPRYAHRLHPSWIDQAPNCARPSETNACCWSGTHSRHLQLFALADFFFLILVGRQCALALSSFPVGFHPFFLLEFWITFVQIWISILFFGKCRKLIFPESRYSRGKEENEKTFKGKSAPMNTPPTG